MNVITTINNYIVLDIKIDIFIIKKLFKKDVNNFLKINYNQTYLYLIVRSKGFFTPSLERFYAYGK